MAQNTFLDNEMMTIGVLINSVNDNNYFVNSNSKIISDGWRDETLVNFILNSKKK